MSRRALRLILLAVAPLLFAHRSRCDTPTTQVGVPSLRNWSDSTGRFHTLGTLVDGDRSSVRIKKETTGTTITVSLARLSAQDRAFVENSLHSTPDADRKASSDRVGNPVNNPGPDTVKSALGWLKDMANSPAVKGIVSLGGDSASTETAPGTGATRAADAVRLPENMVYVRLSKSLLKRFADQDVSLRSAVVDNILGTPVSGVSQTSGHTELELQPQPDVGLGLIHFGGTINCDTVGDAGVVKIFSHVVTQFQSQKSIWVDGQGIHLSPATTTAHTQVTTTGMNTSLPRLRGRIALRIAQSRAAESHAQSEEVTSQHAERRVDRQFDAGAQEQVTKLWKLVNTRLAALPLDDPLRPRGWHARTKPEFLEIVLLGPPGDGSGYVPAPTTRLGSADVRIDIHTAVVKAAMADPAARSVLQAVAVTLTMRPTGSTEMPTIAWSDDSQWLSIAWQSPQRR